MTEVGRWDGGTVGRREDGKTGRREDGKTTERWDRERRDRTGKGGAKGIANSKQPPYMSDYVYTPTHNTPQTLFGNVNML